MLFRAEDFYNRRFLPAIAPLSLIALLFTTLIIFAAQGKQVSYSPHTFATLPVRSLIPCRSAQVVRSITDVLRVIAPLLIYFLIMFFLVLYICKRAGVNYGRSATQAFTGASNNFEVRECSS